MRYLEQDLLNTLISLDSIGYVGKNNVEGPGKVTKVKYPLLCKAATHPCQAPIQKVNQSVKYPVTAFWI